MINVSIEATGKCKRCTHMDLEMNTENILANNNIVARHIEVRCKNEHLCDHLEDYLAAKKTGDQSAAKIQ